MDKTSAYQGLFFGALYTLAVGLKHAPILMIQSAKQNAWHSYILGVILVIPALWLMHRLMKKHQEKNIYELLSDSSPIAGRFIILLFTLYFLLINAHDIRFFINLINILFLPRTPMAVLGGVIIFVAICIAREGKETLTRMAQIFLLPFGILVLFLPFTLATQIELQNVTPIFEGPIQYLQSGFYAFGTMGELIILPLLFSSRSVPLKHTIIAILLGALLLAVMLFSSISVFGPNLTSTFFDPAYMVIRQIRITDFLDRSDLIIAALWIPVIMVKISGSLYIVVYGLSFLHSKVYLKAMYTPTGLFSLVCSFWFFLNTNQLIDFNRIKPIINVVISLLLPLFIYLIIKSKAMFGAKTNH
ncbi:endospore germination permease [Bacillus rugosus]|uniref:endospore germination permease n=1 Tax=Bacillus rugosus TaxID=2715209 RepID=UPI001422952F|nr:endospore germination permease [Bacillus rugosus]NUF04270.1 endospore germination permease [Bacillus rugosus]